MTATPALRASFILLLILAFAPALPLRWPKPRGYPFAVVAVWLTPYFVYALGTGDFRWPAFVRVAGLCVPPLLVYVMFPVLDLARLSWQDALSWLWLSLALLFHQTAGIWMAPKNLDFMSRLFLIMVASWCWVVVRPVPGIGYRLSLSTTTLRAAAMNFVLFAAIAIPASLGLRFAAWNPRWPGIGQFCIEYLEIFVFIAWLEELLFRGFLQTLLSETVNSRQRGQVIASCVFGLSHVFHAPAPNWRYVLLATVAGWFYGQAFRNSGNITGSSMTHALVDTVWRTFFLKQ